MSTQTELLRLSNARDAIRNKMVNLGIGLSTDKLDQLATKLAATTNNGAVTAEVQEGASYTIPAGWHNGAGIVTGVAGGGNYNLQTKRVTPTKESQSVSSDEGYYGLSGVTVDPIPESYQDISATTATAPEVLATKIFVASDGTKTAGTMPNVGKQSIKLSADIKSATISKGYHDGTGTATLDTESKSVTPTTEEQTVLPNEGKVLSEVVVAAIPSKYGDTSGLTDVNAADVLVGKTVMGKSSTGAPKTVTGAMPNIGSAVVTIDGLTETSYSIPKGYHDGTGSVTLTNDILEALEAI